MSELQHYYKVTNFENESLFLGSLTPRGRNEVGKFIVQYKQNEFIKAPIGGCFVFENEQQAYAWAVTITGSFRIWKVTVKDPVELPPYNPKGTKNRIIETWASGGISFRDWPRGTKAFRYVRLNELVEGIYKGLSR